MENEYKKNYLKQVIIRIDFLNPIQSLNTEFPIVLGSIIKNFFPIAEPKDVLARELQFTLDKIDTKETKIKEWNFFGKERDKKLTISQNSMVIIFNIYRTFDDFINPFKSVVDVLFKLFKELQINRVGLRYINNIELSDRFIFNWRNYLNKDLLCIFNIPDDKTKIAKAFHNLEFNYGSYNLRFQYGMHNPDYPSPIKKKTFILDYDAYYEGILTREDIEEKVPIFRKEIKRLFEKSIGEKLRKKMNE